MYEFVDRPVRHLCNGGRFLLWAMRAWTAAASAGGCPPRGLARGFAGLGALGALSDFHAAMALINRDAFEPLHLAPMNCGKIAEDEAVLSSLWHDAALGRADRLAATLALLIDEDGVALVADAMIAATDRLAAAGLGLSDPTREAQKETK